MNTEIIEEEQNFIYEKRVFLISMAVLALIIIVFLLIKGIPYFISRNSFDYDIVSENGEEYAVITRYTGRYFKPNIPSEIEGKPVKKIGEGAFYYRKIKKVILPESITEIGDGAFADCPYLKTIHIPDNVTAIGAEAFEGCSSLKSIKIPDGITSIEYDTFSFCSSLISVEIPESVTYIGSNAFAFCRRLEGVVIPDSVSEIGERAFSCSGLKNIAISSNVTCIGVYAFEYCSSLTSITVDPNNSRYCSDEYGVLFTKDKTVLLEYPCGNKRTSYTIPDSVIKIYDYVFYDCTSLTSITIPESVTTIYDYTFCNCSSLASITIPESVTHIGEDAFFGSGITVYAPHEERYYNKYVSSYTGVKEWIVLVTDITSLDDLIGVIRKE